MTAEPLHLALAFLGGAAAGVAYFLLLWRAIRHLREGGGWAPFILSGALRAGLLLGGLVLLMRAGATLEVLLFAALGFFAARLAATRLARPDDREG